MDAVPYSWSEIAEDNPIPLLTRRMVTGDQALVAMVHLEKGCHVAVHQHVSEQIAVVLSGRVRWTLGSEGSQRTVEMTGGQVMHLPANLPHGVDALEDTQILDILSPVGLMGVDSQGKSEAAASPAAH